MQLPDSFKDFATKHVGRGPTRVFMTYCQREAFHTQLGLIFDDEFIEAYEHGIVICCCDGITRRFYPRVFTHSADYPEKYVSFSSWFLHSNHSNPPGFYWPQFAIEEGAHAHDV